MNDKKEEKEKSGGAAKRPCPHCGKEVEVKTVVCPKCHYVFHWERNNDNSWVRYLQSPHSPWLLLGALVLAAIGQLLLLLTDATISEFVPVPSEYLRLSGHLLKMFGEVVLMTGLAFGLKFESYTLSPVCQALIFGSVGYHLLAGAWPFLLARFGGHPYIVYVFLAVVALLVVYEAAYVVLGVLLYSLYNGQISRVGLLLTIRSAAFLLLNVFLHLSGKNVIVDVSITLLTWVCFYLVWEMLLDHRTYMGIPSSRREQA